MRSLSRLSSLIHFKLFTPNLNAFSRYTEESKEEIEEFELDFVSNEACEMCICRMSQSYPLCDGEHLNQADLTAGYTSAVYTHEKTETCKVSVLPHGNHMIVGNRPKRCIQCFFLSWAIIVGFIALSYLYVKRVKRKEKEKEQKKEKEKMEKGETEG